LREFVSVDVVVGHIVDRNMPTTLYKQSVLTVPAHTQVKTGQGTLILSEHSNSTSALLSFILWLRLEGIFLLIDEADKIKLDSPLGMLLLPMSKDRAERYLASRMCLDIFTTARDVKGKPVPKRDRDAFDFLAEVCLSSSPRGFDSAHSRT
jgi:hypothetical protein